MPAKTASARFHLRQRRLRLRQPEGHVHGPVHRDGGRQLGMGLLPLASLRIQRPEATVAVRLEWAHAWLLGQGEGLLVMGCGRLTLWGIALHGDVAEESKRLRLVAPSWMGTGEFVELFGECARVLDAAHEQQPLAQLSERARSSASMITTVAPGGHVFYGLRKQGRASVVRPLSA